MLIACAGGELQTLDEFSSTVGSVTNSSSHAKTGSRSIRFDDGYGSLLGALTIRRISAWIYLDSISTSFIYCLGTSTLWSLAIGTDRTLMIKEGGATRDTSSEILPLDELHRISISVDSNGLCKAYLDGDEVCSYDGTSTSIENYIGVTGSGDADLYLDDIVFDDAKTSDDLGDCRVALALPIGDSAISDSFTGYPDTTNKYNNVDELPVSETDYNWWECNDTVVRQTHLLTTASNLGLAAGDIIQGVNVWRRYKTGAGGVGDYSAQEIDNGSFYQDNSIDDPSVSTWINRLRKSPPKTRVDIGEPATDRDSYLGSGYTVLTMGNPANADGNLGLIKLQVNLALSGVKIGTFYGSGASWTCRDWISLGALAQGSHQINIYPQQIEVVAGDVIGIYYSAGRMELSTSLGDGVYTKSGDQTETGAQTYDIDVDNRLSLNGESVEWTQAIYNQYEVGMGTVDRNKDIWYYGIYCMVAYIVVEAAGPTDYPINSSVLIGNAVSASRALAIDRDSAVLLGVLVTASRTWGMAKASSVSIGVLVAAAVIRGAERVALVQVGDLVTALRVLDVTRSSSVQIGEAVTASRVWGVYRSSSVAIGNLVTAFYDAVQNFPVSSAVQVGVTVTASRIWGVVASSSVSIGNLVTASRALSASISSSVILGVLATASRALSASRSSSVSIGNLVSALGVLGFVRTSSVSAGNLVSASVIWGAVRSSIVSIGNLVTASRVITVSRSSVVLVGDLVSASVSWGSAVSSSVLIGTLVSASRFFEVARASVVSIGNAVTASRALAMSRSSSVEVGNLVSAAYMKTVLIFSSVSVGNAVSAMRSLAASISSSVSIGEVVSASVSQSMTRLSSVSIGNLVSATAQLTTLVISSVSVGAAVSASRVVDYIRSSTVSVGGLATALRSLSTTRLSSVSIGNLVSASIVLSTMRSSAVSIGNAVSASRVVAYVRASAVSVGEVVTASRLVDFLRSAEVNLGVSVWASVDHIANHLRTASVAVGELVSASVTVAYIRSSTVAVGNKVTAIIETTYQAVRDILVASRAYSLGDKRISPYTLGQVKKVYSLGRMIRRHTLGRMK